jgi:hypothetical protein
MTLVIGLAWTGQAQAKASGQFEHGEVTRDLGWRVQLQTSVDGAGGSPYAEIGMRLWLTETIALDPGIGFLIRRDKTEAVTVGFGMFFGLPIALGNYKHFVPILRPRLDLGVNHIGGTTTTAFRFGLGCDVGAEIHLGFIDLPRVSLTALIGLGFIGDIDGGTFIYFGTAGNNDSFWGLFNSSIAVTYYW